MWIAESSSVSFAQIRRDARLIAERAAHVGVLTTKVEEFAQTFAPPPPLALPRGIVEEHVLEFLLLRAALRFGSGYEPKLTLAPGTRAAEQLDEALGLRFAERGPMPAAEMASATREDLATLRGQGLSEPPQAEFVELQARALRDLGRFLIERHGGSALRLVEAAAGSAARLVEALSVMPFFHDVQRYRGLDAHFYHRGQRFVAEVAATCADLDVGRFDDVRDLAISSDVECAVTLRAAGILVYDGSLTERVDHGELVPAHSEREIEIRAATLHAADRLATAVAAQKPGVLPVDVDRWLRLAARRSIGQPHRTRSVHY